MKKNQSNRIIQQSSNLQQVQLNHPLANRTALATNTNSSNNMPKVAQSQELLPKFFQNNTNNTNAGTMRHSTNFSKKTGNGGDPLVDPNTLQLNQAAASLVEAQRYSVGGGKLSHSLGAPSHQVAQGLNQAKSQANIVHQPQGAPVGSGAINSKSIDAAQIKQSQRRLVQSGQKNIRHNVQQKHQRGTGQPLHQLSSNQTTALQQSQANLSTGGGNLVKYNVKNGNFTFKAAGKNLANHGGMARSDSRKVDSTRVTTSSNRNQLQGGNVSSSVQVQSVRQLTSIGNSNGQSTKASQQLSKRSYVGNSMNSAQVTGGRKLSHQNQQNHEMFNSMGSEQYQQKLLVGSVDDQQVKTNSMINTEIGPLDISGGLKDQRAMRKDDRNKHMLALNKKLIKPLTGNKAQQQNQSQQSLVFPGPQINSLVQGSSEQVLEASRPSDRPVSSDKIPSLNFLTNGSAQHQSQKIRIPKHAIANVNKRNPADISQKGSFVSQRSGANQNNKSTSQQKHAKKNNQQLQQLHGHGGSNSHSSRFGQNVNGGPLSHSLNPGGVHLNMNLNQKLKSTATRENGTNSERRPMLSAITKPRFTSSNRYEDPTGNATEPTLVTNTQGMLHSNQIPKNKTIASNSEKKFQNSDRGTVEGSTKDGGFNTHGKSEARSNSRTIGQFIPTQSTNSVNNVSGNQNNIQMSGTQQRAHILKQSKSNITSKTIGLMQQRMLKTASNNADATENLLKQAQYISSQKSGQPGMPATTKVNPLLQSADASNPLFGLPPMQGGGHSSKQFARSRGASSGNANNILSSKNIADTGKKAGHTSNSQQNDLQFTPQAPSEETKKRNTAKQSRGGQNFMLSPNVNQQMTPYNDGNNHENTQKAQRKQSANGKTLNKSPLNQFQSTPNSNNTTSVILGSREQVVNPITNDSLEQNYTYRSENVKSVDNPLLKSHINKNQKKLNTLLTEAQNLQQESLDGSPQQVPINLQRVAHSGQQRLQGSGNQQNSDGADNNNNLFHRVPQSQNQQLQGQQVVIPQHQLIQDREKERNDTIPEEPTISMDEFQSNQASFNGNPVQDPNSGYHTGAPGSVQGQAKHNNNPNTQYIDSESIQKQKDGERENKRKPDQPAGPASIKGLNRRREHKLLQSQNLVTSKSGIGADLMNQQKQANDGVGQSLDGVNMQQNLMPQSQSSDKLNMNRHNNVLKASLQKDTSPSQKMMVKLSDRLQQNPVNFQQAQTSSQEKSNKTTGKVQLQSNQVGRSEGDKLRKLDSPNDDLDEDQDFDDCDKEGTTQVPDENTNLAMVKGLNPKSQLHNNIGQRANRNQQIDQPVGDKTNRGTDDQNSNAQTDRVKDEKQKISQISSNPVHRHSNSMPRVAQPPAQPQSIRKVEDQVAQFAYLTKAGKTSDGNYKTNQDNFFVVKNFAKIENLWYFGVCDGHGQNGHMVSEYVKNKLALDIMEVDIAHKEQQALRMAKQKLLGNYDGQDSKDGNSFDSSDNVPKSGNSFYKRKQSHDGTKGDYNELADGMTSSANRRLSHKRKSQDERTAEITKLKSQIMKGITSNLLQQGPKLNNVFIEGFTKNDSNLRYQGYGFEFSGTTIVTAMVQGNRIVTANAGDSRTVIGSLKSRFYQVQDPKIEAKALTIEQNDKAWFTKMITRDHKPDDPDEMARIEAMNGRIESYKGRYGENVGPARVWLKTEQYPGLAMSRSIGDACAHSVGVSAIPEIFEFMTDDDDKFMILASDGVWEFLSNEQVIDMIVPYWHRNDLKGACSTVVKKSVEAWEEEEESIDDITCIIVFFKRSGPVTDYSKMPQEASQPQARAGNTRDSSLNQKHNNNSGGTGQQLSASAGDNRQGKGNQYQHKGRHLKKSKDTASTSTKK